MPTSRGTGQELDAGFTLVEVIVAMVLLGLVAVAMVPVLATGARTAASNRETSKAAQYVATELATARAMPCATVRDTVDTTKGGRGYVSDDSATDKNGNPIAYSFYTLKSTFVDTPGGSCKKGEYYRLTATATLSDGTLQPVSASTLILVT